MTTGMAKGRVEAFSDGVLAIVITIMVLELKTPHSPDITALRPLLPVFLGYVLSFIYVGIFWNNHHHLFHAAREVSGGVLWANNHLLFWLSLIPFSTGWMGETHFAAAPLAIYGLNLFLAALAWRILQARLVSVHGADSPLSHAFRRDFKGSMSLMLYLLAVPLAFWQRWLSGALYVTVALMWLLPEQRIERELSREDPKS